MENYGEAGIFRCGECIYADKTVIYGVKVGDYLLHISNEGKRGPKAARDAKRLGVRAGMPELFLAYLAVDMRVCGLR